MTKLEFLDRINDILIGLNTAESDALGSLYDELVRDIEERPKEDQNIQKKFKQMAADNISAVCANMVRIRNGGVRNEN